MESNLEKNFRISQHNYSQKDIYKYVLAEAKIVRITDLPFSDETSPREEANGERSNFISDLNGINNIYTKSLLRTDGSINNHYTTKTYYKFYKWSLSIVFIKGYKKISILNTI
jgi:hypothetical protein